MQEGRNRLGWLGLLGVAAGLAGAATETPAPVALGLEAAIARALVFNRELALEQLDVRGGALGVSRARLPFQTRILPDSRVTAGGEDTDWQVGALAVRRTTWGTEWQVGARQGGRGGDREAGVRAELRQPLFRDFGRDVHLEPLRQADERLLAVRRAFEDRRAVLALSVIELYYRLNLLEENVAADEALAQRTDVLARLTRARERLGRTTRVDSLRVELQRGEALARIAGNRERLATARRDLADLLGLPPGTVLALEPPPVPEVEWPGLETALAIAWSRRMDYAQARSDLAARRRGTTLAARAVWPDLTLIAGYERFGEASEWDAAWRLPDERWYVGLSTDSDLLRREARLEAAAADLDEDSARERLVLLRRSIMLDLQQRLAAGRAAATEAGIAARNLELAAGRARLARRLFELGRGDNFAVTDAEQALSEAENRLRAARAEQALSVYRLARSLGTLIESPPELRDPAEGES